MCNSVVPARYENLATMENLTTQLSLIPARSSETGYINDSRTDLTFRCSQPT